MARLTTLTAINFTPSADTHPTSTQVGTTITSFYKMCYRYVYGLGTYSSDESTDAENVIDSDEFRDLLDAEVSAFCQQWNEAGKPSGGGAVRKMPKRELTDEFKSDIRDLLKDSRPLIENIRTMGNDYFDETTG